MEANIVRPFVTKALQTFHKLNTTEAIPESGSIPNRQRQAVNQRDKVNSLLFYLPYLTIHTFSMKLLSFIILLATTFVILFHCHYCPFLCVLCTTLHFTLFHRCYLLLLSFLYTLFQNCLKNAFVQAEGYQKQPLYLYEIGAYTLPSSDSTCGFTLSMLLLLVIHFLTLFSLTSSAY